MINPKDIQSCWDNMGSQQHVGILKRKLQLQSRFIVYCLFKYPENFCAISLTFSNTIKPNIKKFQKWQTFDVKTFSDSAYPNSTMLMVMLKSQGHNVAFSNLCASLINRIEKASDEKEAVNMFVNQLEEWRQLFKTYQEGLGEGAQIGLWGELHLLETILNNKPNISQDSILDFWVGSQKSIQDFQGNGWAIEVKATTKNDDSNVEIHGDRQLDESLFNNLFLNRITLDKTAQNGLSLPDKVERIKFMLSRNALALTLFEMKLVQYGYLDSMKDLYTDTTYQIRNNQYFRIEGDFPRIKEGELRSGVSNVKYHIDLNLASSYEQQEQIIISVI